MPSSKDLFSRFPNEVFVETGTWNGVGVWCALEAGFKLVRSTELGQHLYEACCNRYASDKRVELFLGSSEDQLWNMIKDINVPITFWLDAHYSEGNTARGNQNCPLLIELDIINQHPIKNHIILIDDIRYMSTEVFDYMPLENVIKKIMLINPNYQIYYADGVLQNDIMIIQEMNTKYFTKG